ncbi:hypothetical protein ACRYCC_03230 [Actinomadura scrupuli]|uniref:hypothetical protein n=1 Tax=Actinomadura scrupuli TaxID=559629 RepID=UPI003D962FC3
MRTSGRARAATRSLALGTLLFLPPGAVLAGCHHGPGLSESADQLRADTRAMLASAAGRLGPPGARPRVLLDTLRPCTGGRARRLFRAEVPLRPSADREVLLDRATDLSLSTITARGYRLEAPPHGRSPRVFTMTHDLPAVTVTVRLWSGRRPAMRFDARTPCLARS